MTAAETKPVNAMARLHLGCGESLSQLLPDQPPRSPAIAPVRRPAARRQSQVRPGKAGERE